MTSSTHTRCMNNITGMDITNSVYACSFGLREIVAEICSFFILEGLVEVVITAGITLPGLCSTSCSVL